MSDPIAQLTVLIIRISGHLEGIISTISRQLEWMNGDTFLIQLRHKSIAELFLWVTRLETASESQCFHDTRRQFLDLWGRINLTYPQSAGLYLDALLSSTDINGDRVTERPGSERVAGVASMYLLHALSRLSPTSREFEDTCHRYVRVIPHEADFEGSFFHTMSAIHALLVSSQERRCFEWTGYGPCAQEHASFANTLVQAAYNRRQRGKVPRWILRFALHSISQDPPPPTSVVVDCLTIVSIDLGCDVSSVMSTTLDERCVYI